MRLGLGQGQDNSSEPVPCTCLHAAACAHKLPAAPHQISSRMCMLPSNGPAAAAQTLRDHALRIPVPLITAAAHSNSSHWLAAPNLPAHQSPVQKRDGGFCRRRVIDIIFYHIIIIILILTKHHTECHPWCACACTQLALARRRCPWPVAAPGVCWLAARF